MSDRDPVTIDEWRKAWNKLIQFEDDSKDMPIHPFGSFRFRADGQDYCMACKRLAKERNQLQYGKLCFGKRRWWFFGRFLCPRTPHLHVKCLICNAPWFESMKLK